MISYSIIPPSDLEVISVNGAHQTVPGSQHYRRPMSGSQPTEREIVLLDRSRLAMATYRIVLHTDGIAFDIEIVSTDGTRHTMLGFATGGGEL